jgi:hypothetical protein
VVPVEKTHTATIAMNISKDWLAERVEMREVEEWLAEEGAPDLWLEEWRGFVGHFTPGDELWDYFALIVDDPMGEGWDSPQRMVGFALVRNGEIVESISTTWY